MPKPMRELAEVSAVAVLWIAILSVLYGLTWTFYAIAGAIGPVLMGKAFDLTGSYEALLLRLSIGTFAVGSLMLFLPRYRAIPFPSTHT